MSQPTSLLGHFADLVIGTAEPQRLGERALEVVMALVNGRSSGVFQVVHQRLTLFASRGIDQHVLDEYGLGLAIVEDVSNLVALQHEVDRHHDGADLRKTVAAIDVLKAVVRHEDDAIAPANAHLQKCVGRLAAPFVHLLERYPLLSADKRDAVAKAFRRAGNQIADDVAAQQVLIKNIKTHGLFTALNV